MIIYLFKHTDLFGNENKYIGSTKNLKLRCWAHNQHKKQERHKNIRLYKYLNINEIEDIRPYITVLFNLEEIFNNLNCNDSLNKIILKNKEQDFLENIKPNLNMIKALRR